MSKTTLKQYGSGRNVETLKGEKKSRFFNRLFGSFSHLLENVWEQITKEQYYGLFKIHGERDDYRSGWTFKRSLSEK